MRFLGLIAVAAAAAAALSAPAAAAPGARFGVQDDAWLMHGPGTLTSRLNRLDRLGVDVVRFTLRWDQIAPRRPRSPRSPADRAYRWGSSDAVLRGLRARGISAVATLLGTPAWANGRLPWQWAPDSGEDFADFAYAAATRYSWVRDWLVWNEPNQRRWLQPVSPAVYVERLLNPAYEAIHQARAAARVGGGVTAPRGSTGGMSPVAWIRGMGAARARLDAYAHHPYPDRPRVETPSNGGCRYCATITMATVGRLLTEVTRAFGAKRIWLTEYAYQTNPPDYLLGVAPALQARYIAEGAYRAYAIPRVDMLIHYVVRDDADIGGWQSGLFTRSGSAKPAAQAFALPLAQVARRGSSVTLWGQVRPRAGRQPYRLRVATGGRWSWLGGTRWTNARGAFSVRVAAARGTRVQVWSPRDRAFGVALALR